MAKGGKTLSRGDRAVWKKVAVTTRPLPGRMDRLLAEAADTAPDPAIDPNGKEPVRPAPQITGTMKKILAESFASGVRRDPSGPPPASRTRHASTIERPVHRKLARGRLPLDDRLDLHGLDQEAAHRRLMAFLLSASRRGMRHVLVITGKGASHGSEGALKRSVPVWLSQPDFRILVSGYEWAARGHGGEGALYVRLKRRREQPR